LDQYTVSPEACLVVRAVSQSKTIREAAVILNCDPATLVRKIHQIAAQDKLLQKIKGHWVLTHAGRQAVLWLEASIALQKIKLTEKPRLRISATMWMAEQILIPNIRSLQSEIGHEYSLFLRSVGGFESDILNGLTDYVIACHRPNDPSIAHRKVGPEKWIVVAPMAWAKQIKQNSREETFDFLKTKLFIRHSSINPEMALDLPADSTIGIESKTADLLFDSLISVRTAIEVGLGWSCVPEFLATSSIKNELVLKLNLDVKTQGELCVWWLRNQNESAIFSKNLVKWLSSII
jgi:DNA-binding transcriptional LysR family regulator